MVRVAYQALAAVLGGCQSLHTNSRDEALALPTEESAKIALRTQQVLAHETGVTHYADPLAGSYLLESMTLDIEREARALIEKIDAIGGARAAIESGFVQHEIGESAYRAQRALEEKTAIVVGVNEFVDDTSAPLPILIIDESVERDQVARLRSFREKRGGDVAGALSTLDAAAREGRNLMPPIVGCVRSDCTVGETAPSSSRKSVPPSARWNAPLRSLSAPVKAPRT